MQKEEILEIYGQNIAEMAAKLAEAADLAGLIGARDKSVGLKPNYVNANPADSGATTHTEVIEGLVLYLKEKGFYNLTILEGSWVGARTQAAFSASGVQRLAQKHNLQLVDTQKDSAKPYDCAGLPIEICDTAMAVDFMINLPVMKGHCQTLVTCALKNNKGVIPNSEKRRFHALGLHKPIAHLNTVAKNDFILVDAICGDLDFEEGGNPVWGNRLFAARDPVLCDAYAASQMGYDPAEVAYIGMAAALGAGSDDLSAARVRQVNSGAEAGPPPRPTGKARQLAKHIGEDSACSACCAALTRGLSRLSARQREALPGPVCIGQGHRGKSGKLGVGKCTAAFEHTLPGCPPSAEKIAEFLQGL